ncbi:MAG: rhamnogalacturonan endolyase family protein [Planctomycetota bacterium]|jgi:rhamnogalacturonan endolyase
MIRRILLIVMLLCTVVPMAVAEDPRERQYFTPALNPKHKDKPKVRGWAKQRIDEKINRGMLAMPNKEGKVYLGWRLLKSDAKGTAFNVYRSIEGGNPIRLNKEPVVADN